MRQLIDEKAIRLNYSAADWRAAVGEAGRLLEETGIVESRYVDAMIQMVEDHGAYIIVAPGIAIPHARAESGAKSTGISFLLLENPVCFPQKEENPIWILIGVAATNKEEHLEIFGQVAEKIVNADVVEKLKSCVLAEDIVRILSE